MFELFLMLFVLQGDKSNQWIDSCYADFNGYEEKLSEINPDIFFCRAVIDLNLNENDIDKLGYDLNWLNYTIHTVKEFVNNWDLYDDYAIKDTLLIYPSISTRDSLPPGIKVQISFDYQKGDSISTFDESFKISPEFNPPVCQKGSEIFKCISKNPESYESDKEITSPQFRLDCPITTHKFSQETQKCEIW